MCVAHQCVVFTVINNVAHTQPIASTSQIVVHTLMMVTLEVFDEESLGDSEVCLSVCFYAAITVVSNCCNM